MTPNRASTTLHLTMDTFNLIKMILTYLVPFSVSTHGASRSYRRILVMISCLDEFCAVPKI